MTKEYQCANCKGVFKSGWSDEEAKQEAEHNFGEHPDEWEDEQMLVCDNCYRKVFDAEKDVPPIYPDPSKKLFFVCPCCHRHNEVGSELYCGDCDKKFTLNDML